jgi:hypothetical protein
METRTLRDGNIVLALACNEYRLIAEKLPYLKSLGTLIDCGAPDYNSYIAECAAGWYTCTEHEHNRASYYLGQIAHEQRMLAARRAARTAALVNRTIDEALAQSASAKVGA